MRGSILVYRRGLPYGLPVPIPVFMNTYKTDQISRVLSGALWGTLDCLCNTL